MDDDFLHSPAPFRRYFKCAFYHNNEPSKNNLEKTNRSDTDHTEKNGFKHLTFIGFFPYFYVPRGTLLSLAACTGFLNAQIARL